MRALFKVAPTILCMFLFACSSAVEKDLPKSLLIYRGATNISTYREGSVRQLSYKLSVKYPAEEVIAFVRTELKREGWHALPEDYLNPGLASSHVTGWNSHQDGTGKMIMEVHQWLAQWKNNGGDVVWYVFRYTYPHRGRPDMDTLDVFASYFPSDIARKQLEMVLREKKPSN
jgi:hypothetical protein